MSSPSSTPLPSLNSHLVKAYSGLGCGHHHLYKMDYRKLIEAHRKSNADITIAAASPTHLEVDSKNQVTDFHVESRASQEKPRNLNGMTETRSGTMFENMGIYVINRGMLRKLVNESFPERHWTWEVK
ncbi:Inactive glucose-1-phosphate adenylyltransferase small subunit 2, chloroplastic [Linum perenne]